MKRGKFLAKLRIKAGLSQNDVAEKLNYSPQLVSLWEKDKTNKPVATGIFMNQQNEHRNLNAKGCDKNERY